MEMKLGVGVGLKFVRRKERVGSRLWRWLGFLKEEERVAE